MLRQLLPSVELGFEYFWHQSEADYTFENSKKRFVVVKFYLELQYVH